MSDKQQQAEVIALLKHEIILLHETLNYCQSAFEEIGVSEKDRGSAVYKAWDHVECSLGTLFGIQQGEPND